MSLPAPKQIDGTSLDPVPHHWPEATRRLWPVPAGTDGGRGTAGGATHLFRRRFMVPPGARAVTLWIFAEGNFAVWLDGKKIGRGPWLHRPERRTVTELRLPTVAGEHVLAVAVQHLETSIFKLVLTGEPGLLAQVRVEHGDGRVEEWVSDAAWRRAPVSGWRKAVRRGFALPHVEWIDAAVHPDGWNQAAYDDSAWPAAECQPVRGPEIDPQWFRVPLPDLSFQEVVVRGAPSLWRVPATPFDLASADAFWQWGDHLQKDQERWSRLAPGQGGDSGVREEPAGVWSWNARPDEGLVLAWDLGELHVGAVRVELECEAGGVCEVLWSERVREGGEVWAYLKGTTYADRWELAPGRHLFSPAGYSSMQHVALVFRGCSGRMRVSRLLVESGRLDTGLDQVDVRLPSPRLQAIWDLCHRTVMRSPQDGMTDCPSREQSVYTADGPLAGEWMVALGADLRLARHTLREVFLTEREGFIPDCIYSAASRSLVDFGLIAVRLLGRFVRRHGDAALARELWPRARAVIERMNGLRDERGFIAVDWLKANRVPPQALSDFQNYPPMTPWLFIDHPGMGWHNVGEPEIQRGGINTAVHALLVLAMRGGADVAALAGAADEASRLTRLADELALLLRTRFWDAERRLFPDGLALDGTRHVAASAQTNTLCLLARVVPPDAERELARRAAVDALPGAWNGPYIHGLLLEVLVDLGLREEALALIERRWGPMVDAGASCAWETFAGDHLDSWCHPWAASPVMWLPRLTGAELVRREAADGR